jgi:hypothetical protein
VRNSLPSLYSGSVKGLMYLDKDKQRESDRERAKAYRLRKKGVTESVTPEEIVTPEVSNTVTPASHPPEFVKGMGEWVRKRGKVVIPGAIKTVADVPKLTPRSIGMGVDSKGEMISRFLKGVK